MPIDSSLIEQLVEQWPTDQFAHSAFILPDGRLIGRSTADRPPTHIYSGHNLSDFQVIMMVCSAVDGTDAGRPYPLIAECADTTASDELFRLCRAANIGANENYDPKFYTAGRHNRRVTAERR